MPSPSAQQQQAWPASSSANKQHAPGGSRQQQQQGSENRSLNGRRPYQSVTYPPATSGAATVGGGRAEQKEGTAYTVGNWMPGSNKKLKTPARKGLVRRKGEKNMANWGVYDRYKAQPFEVDLPPLGYKRGEGQDESEKNRWGSKKDAGVCGLM